MNSSKTKYYSNLQAAIRLANNSYSDNVNKLLISLYDDVPNTAIGVSNTISYGGIFSEYDTVQEAAAGKCKQLVSKTKSEILSLQKSNIDFILLRPGDTNFDRQYYNSVTGELTYSFDGSQYVKELYGTIDNPTYGRMYSLNDASLETIVSEYIYSDIIETIGSKMTSTEIKDYFPKEILENFDITISDKNKNDVDTTNLETDGYILWNIGELEVNKTATLEYTLKIKNMKNEALLNKTISTNEKVELTYVDYLDAKKSVTLTSSPKIQLSEEKEELTATVSYDPTSNTTGTVKATIKTNKEVKPVDGWTLSEDGKTLTKTYSENTTETVHLVDIDNMEKDVTIKITNIIKENINPGNSDSDDDKTTAPGAIPQTGAKITIIFIILGILAISFITLKKYHGYKDIK